MTMKRLLSCIALSLCWTVATANEPVGHAVAVLGTVTVDRAETGERDSLPVQGALFLNDTVTTGADGLAKLLMRDDSILKVSPGSELQINAMLAGPGEGGESTVNLLKGRIRSVIGNSLGENSEFSVKTPVAVAGVRGTDFEVVHLFRNGQWVTGVRTYSGAVEFTAGAGTGLIILPQQYSLATVNEPPSAPEAIAEDTSLYDLLAGDGIDDNIELPDESVFESDEVLDIEEVQATLLNLNRLNISDLETLLNRQSAIQTPAPATTEDVQVDVVNQPVTGNSSLDFTIDIPLPN